MNNNRLQNFTSFFPYFSALPLHPSLPPTPPSPLRFLFLPLSPSLSFSLPLRGRHNSLGLERHLCRSGSNKGKSPCAGALQLQKRAGLFMKVKYRWGEPRSHLRFQPIVPSPDHSEGRAVRISCQQLSKSRRSGLCSGKPLPGETIAGPGTLSLLCGQGCLFLNLKYSFPGS